MDRKLATIFASDVVGFSKMMGTDEVNTLKILKLRRDVIDGIIDEHDGIIFGSAGDSVIAEFASPIKAAEAAVETQVKMNAMNQDQEEAEALTGNDSDSFVNSLPYEQKDMLSDLRETLQSCKA